MRNERDCLTEYFEATAVSRGEFEALKRFGDYKELADGTLMRMEGNKEFRIYCEECNNVARNLVDCTAESRREIRRAD